MPKKRTKKKAAPPGRRVRLAPGTAGTVGRALDAVRREKGWSVYALARRAGVSHQAAGYLLADASEARWETVRRLAGTLGVSLDYLSSLQPPVEYPPDTPRPRPGRPSLPKPEENGDSPQNPAPGID